MQPRIEKQGQNRAYIWHTLTAALAFCVHKLDTVGTFENAMSNHRDRDTPPDRASCDSMIASRARFMGRKFESWEKLFDALNSAWRKGQKAISDMSSKLGQIDLGLRSIRDVPRWEMAGTGRCDYHRMRAGQKFMRRRKRAKVKCKRVRLAFECVASAGVDANKLLWTGAACSALAEALCSAGYAVAITAVSLTRGTCNGTGGLHSLQVDVKDYGDPLNLDLLSAVSAGWFYRSIIFQLKQAVAEDFDKSLTYGLGRVTTTSERQGFGLEAVNRGEENVIYIPRVFSEDGAFRAMQDAVKKAQEIDAT